MSIGERMKTGCAHLKRACVPPERVLFVVANTTNGIWKWRAGHLDPFGSLPSLKNMVKENN